MSPQYNNSLQNCFIYFRKTKNTPRGKQSKDTVFSSEKLANTKNQSKTSTSTNASPRTQTSGKTAADFGLPNVQSKETLLTEFNYNETFSKRKVESNWSKYEELPDAEDNEQLLAANFEEMLLGSQTVCSHFTFSSEKHWDNLEADSNLQQSHSINDRLFKLNLNLLKTGLGGLPFDVRLGYSENLFNDLEMTDITTRVGCYDRFVRTIVNNEDVDLITRFEKIDAKAKIVGECGQQKTVEKDIGTEKGEVSGQGSQTMANSRTNLPVSSIKPPSAGVNNDPSKPPKPAITVALQSIDNIQGWLDDILNNG